MRDGGADGGATGVSVARPRSRDDRARACRTGLAARRPEQGEGRPAPRTHADEAVHADAAVRTVVGLRTCPHFCPVLHTLRFRPSPTPLLLSARTLGSTVTWRNWPTPSAVWHVQCKYSGRQQKTSALQHTLWRRMACVSHDLFPQPPWSLWQPALRRSRCARH